LFELFPQGVPIKDVSFQGTLLKHYLFPAETEASTGWEEGGGGTEATSPSPGRAGCTSLQVPATQRGRYQAQLLSASRCWPWKQRLSGLAPSPVPLQRPAENGRVLCRCWSQRLAGMD